MTTRRCEKHGCKDKDGNCLIDGLKLAASDGSIDSDLPTVPVTNIKKVNLYVLILASKNPLGQKIWSSIIKMSPDGQRNLF